MESYLAYVKLPLPGAVVNVGAYQTLDGVGSEQGITGVDGAVNDTIATNSQHFHEL
jgi:hypothetical protein